MRTLRRRWFRQRILNLWKLIALLAALSAVIWSAYYYLEPLP